MSAATLLLSSRFSPADTCPSDTPASMPPDEELLDHDFQPPDGDILHRNRFVPPNAGPNSKFPTVLMLPPDVFNALYGDHGVPHERWATRDLQYSGFLVFQIDHRLAPGHGGLPGQDIQHGSLGRPPDQTDDVKRQILAALADPSCNGSIYLVGGSAGGCLALWCALDSATGAVNGWNNNARLKVKAVVSLSGVTNLYDWSNPSNVDLATFIHGVDNYAGLPDNDDDQSVLYPISPISLVSTATSSPPVMLYATQYDSVPYPQAETMANALRLQFPGVAITEYTLPNIDLHAFNYWHTQNPLVTPSDCVSHQVITFLQAH